MIWSISFSFRLGLAFHALNNEGSDGSNLMQPRRIDVGRVAHDGISGEIVRRHILENFVNICELRGISVLPASKALHPDRGPLALREVAKSELLAEKLTKDNVFKAARKALEKCALVDIGGFLAAFSGEEGRREPIPESDFLKKIAQVAKDDERPSPIKRDSVFDVGWLISEDPQDMTVTQHAAYRPTGDQSLFSQTMRTNVYAGVIRADLHRIGTDDYWYLHSENGEKAKRIAIDPKDIRKRQLALIQAILDYIGSPTGAKTAGWAPHVFKTEGVILLTSARTAPFASPIAVNLSDPERKPIRANPAYKEQIQKLSNGKDTWVWPFSGTPDLFDAYTKINGCLSAATANETERE